MSAVEVVGNGDGAMNRESFIIGNRDPHLDLKEARSRIEEALGKCLLPSLQLIPANPAVGQEIWEVMNLLPYEVGLTSVLFDLLFENFVRHARQCG